MKTIALVVAVIATAAASGFAWQRNQALEEARTALANANSQLQKAQSDLRSVGAEVAPLRKESAEQKAMIEQQRVELASAKAFLDSERASTMRIREELAAAKGQIAFMSRSRAAQGPVPSLHQAPVMIRPQPPMVIRAAPSSGNTQGNAVRAQ